MEHNYQTNTWTSEFGKEYTERNIYGPNELDTYYKQLFGLTRKEMNTRFLKELNLYDNTLLEVGCNVGNQLRLLKEMGFSKLYGLELQAYAVERAKSLTAGVNILQGSGEDIPFKDGYFELVYTSGVLIHIHPQDIKRVLSEIYRCTKQYIWGFEYFAETYTEINYRGQDNLLWKTNFAQLYLEMFPDLQLVKEERYKYIENDNVDSMFLLKKSK